MSHRMSPLRVLVADDEAPAREELAWLLGRDPEVGEVRTAATGAEVLRSLDAHEVDALFLDIRMPGLDGLDVARRVREDERGGGRRTRLLVVGPTGGNQLPR